MGPEGGIGLPTPVSELVDRETEIGEVLSLLRTSRLITLTGPGGIGKTRLAIAVARAALDAADDPGLAEFADGGAAFVPLAGLGPADHPVRAVAAALDISGIEGVDAEGARAEQHLVDALRRRGLLLVLDNCEHQLEPAAGLALKLLTSCRRLTVLATSREPLGVPGETVWTVPPLSHPVTISRGGDDRTGERPADRTETQPAIDAEWAARYGAVRLFTLRATQASRSFQLTDANARAVASICRRLDGIPLAVELAAARVRALSVEEIEARLSDRFALLSGPFRFAETRHRTLRTSVEWSHQLLTEDEQELFAYLSVFSGGWTLEAAEAIYPTALEHLARLVDKSLVAVEPTPHGPRYSMLETIRAYAADQLARLGRTAEVSTAHAAYFLHLSESVSAHFYSHGQVKAFSLLDAEINNLRAAGRWFLAVREPEAAEAALRMAAALWDFYCCRCHLSEGIRFARGALSGARDVVSPTVGRARARATLGLGALLQLHGDAFDSIPVFRRAVELARAESDLVTEAYALRILAMNSWLNGDPDGDAAALTDRAKAVADASGSLWHRAFAGQILTTVHGFASPEAEEQMRTVWLLHEKAGDRRLLSYLRVIRAFHALGGADDRGTVTMLNEAYQDFHTVGDRYGRLLALSTRLLAQVRWNGDTRVAAMLIGKCESAYSGIGSGPLSVFREGIAAAAATIRSTLGEDLYAEAVRSGVQLTWDGLAVALAEEVECWDADRREPDGEADVVEASVAADSIQVADRTHGSVGDLAVLTPRERQIAGQVALGLTNRRIAADLVISERTVDTHVQRVLAKLGLANRVQLATLLAARGE
jgi:predicted ATPase/DNA-binding CsgD family transcriptional regulator